jgi:AcrR family transcriptional regulator
MTAMNGGPATEPGDGSRSVGGASVPAGRRLTADARRRQLFEVALSLFAEHGYASTTMDDIAEAAGVTKPLVYQHFESKRALYLELMDVFSKELVTGIVKATANAEGPRQQVELGFAAYFKLVVSNEAAFRLLYGRDDADDQELGRALRTVEDAMAEAIDPLIDAGLDADHRRLLAYGIVGMAEGASRHFMTNRPTTDADEEAQRLAGRMADLAWAGLRSVHAD